MPSSGGRSEGPLISNPAHASHFMVEAQKRKRRKEREASDECICGEINARHCPVHNEPEEGS